MSTRNPPAAATGMESPAGASTERDALQWRNGPLLWGVLAALAALVGFVFYDGIVELLRIWSSRDEYNHGFLIPVISLFLVWRLRADVAQLKFEGSWVGVLMCMGSLAVLAVGELAAIYALVQYAMIGFIAGAVLALVGWSGARLLWVPVVYLAFMVPLPVFVYQKLSSFLQLVSSELGVAVIRAFGISVFLDGNVIDLGEFKLQVVEACSGLRYLFPLMSFGFLCAYLFEAPVWQRALVFLSTAPITVLMNSFRIGVIGVLVEHYGIEMAEGFLHDFEGWVIFMACVGILLLEMWLLTRLTRPKARFDEVFGVDFGRDRPPAAERRARRLPVPFTVAAVLLVPVGAALASLDARSEFIPERRDFTAFPLKVGEWEGRSERLPRDILDVLGLDDYVVANYRDEERNLVNFYSAWYDSQRKGQSVHSPASCIPGGGWKIADIEAVDVPGVVVHGVPLRANRVLIRKGDQRQLVYYWFQQRGRLITNEYVFKAMLVYDSIAQQRTDGALVRLVTPLREHESVADGEQRLRRFVADTIAPLEATIPA